MLFCSSFTQNRLWQQRGGIIHLQPARLAIAFEEELLGHPHWIFSMITLDLDSGAEGLF